MMDEHWYGHLVWERIAGEDSMKWTRVWKNRGEGVVLT
jgi:hypothetical protein